jgi:hypothetical protein
MDLDEELENALQVCNNLSRDSREAGDLPTMYSANRAWNALFEARNDLKRRRNALAPRASKVTNGEQA